jgi:hypothetical protein
MLSDYVGNANPTPGAQASNKPVLIALDPSVGPTFPALDITGAVTFDALDGVLWSDGSNGVSAAAPGTAQYVLMSNGPGSLPTFQEGAYIFNDTPLALTVSTYAELVAAIATCSRASNLTGTDTYHTITLIADITIPDTTALKIPATPAMVRTKILSESFTQPMRFVSATGASGAWVYTLQILGLGNTNNFAVGQIIGAQHTDGSDPDAPLLSGAMKVASIVSSTQITVDTGVLLSFVPNTNCTTFLTVIKHKIIYSNQSSIDLAVNATLNFDDIAITESRTRVFTLDNNTSINANNLVSYDNTAAAFFFAGNESAFTKFSADTFYAGKMPSGIASTIMGQSINLQRLIVQGADLAGVEIYNGASCKIVQTLIVSTSTAGIYAVNGAYVGLYSSPPATFYQLVYGSYFIGAIIQYGTEPDTGTCTFPLEDGTGGGTYNTLSLVTGGTCIHG